MMYTTYQHLVSYFQALPTVVTDLKGATVGHDEEIEDLQNTRIQYPHLWVETPDVKFRGTDVGPTTRFDFHIAVITNEPLRHPDAANSRLSEMLEIMEALWRRLLRDADEGLFDLILTESEGEPIRKWSGDNVYGWRMRISIEIFRPECYDDPYIAIEL